MVSEQVLEVHKKFVWVLVTLFLLVAVFAAREAAGASLSELISKAKEEGDLTATVHASIKAHTRREVAAAFNKRFRLNIRVTLAAVRDGPNYAEAISETSAGIVPTYDAVQSGAGNNMALMAVGGTSKVQNWKSLLAEINPLVRDGKARAEEVSPSPLTGFAFMYASRLKTLLYNPRLISAADVPRTHIELAEPKYKGMWTHPPWTSHWIIGPLVYREKSKQEWLEIVKKAGRNSGAVQREASGVQRMLVGEFSFALADARYPFQFKDAPMEFGLSKDYNQSTGAYYAVRKGARNPAAATLFALWMGTPEAESRWQLDGYLTNHQWGQSKLDRKLREMIRKSGAVVVDLLSTEEGRDYLEWLATKEGRQYNQAIGRAIRGQ